LPPGSSGNNGTTLCIEDPLDSTNDVGRGSFLFYRVKSTFEDAYITLQRELGTRKLFREPSSIETTSQKDIDADAGQVETSDGCNRYSILLLLLGGVTEKLLILKKKLEPL